MDWREYQEAVADLFRSLGCEVETNETVQGARAEHDIDVWVTFRRFGLQNKWIIECKYWNSIVPKEKVQALKSIVEDIGADKGIIVTEIGFQSGAIYSSNFTNISLKIFKKLKESVKEEIEQKLIKNMGEKVDNLLHRTHGFVTNEVVNENLTKIVPKQGVNSTEYDETMGKLYFVEFGLKFAERGEFPAPISFIKTEDKVVGAKDIVEFLEKAEFILIELKSRMRRTIFESIGYSKLKWLSIRIHLHQTMKLRY